MTDLFKLIFVSFVFGIIHGSLFNVVALRIPKGESIVYPDSHCTSCNRYLKWYELVPVFSYIFLGGKCRTCKSKVSILYPITEFIMGCLFVAVTLSFGVTLETLFYLLICSLVVIISITDVLYEIIPNKIMLFFSAILIPLCFFVTDVTWQGHLWGLGIAIIINLLILVGSRGRGMGGGDVKLYLLLGLILGASNFIVLFMVSVIIGLIVGVYVKATTKEKIIPFGPAIALATITTIFYGQKLLDWYVGIVF